jgi:hypothetical protein
MLKHIITAAGIIVISFIIFFASFRVPDLLKNKQFSKNTPPRNPPASNEKNIDEKKWLDIWFKAIPGTELSKLATEKLTDSGYFDRTEKERALRCSNALKLAQSSPSSSESIVHWRDVWFHSKIDSETFNLAKERLEILGYFKKMEAEKIATHQRAQLDANTAKTEAEWQNIWFNAIPETDLAKLAINKLDQLAYFKKSQINKEIDHKKAELIALAITHP